MFNFRFSSNPLTKATTGLAATVLIVGMLLLGFALLIYALRALFGFIMAMFFVLAGVSTIGFSIKLFIASRRIDKASKRNEVYRKNVRIHRPEDDHFDQ